jgi:hypothetical protein
MSPDASLKYLHANDRLAKADADLTSPERALPSALQHVEMALLALPVVRRDERPQEITAAIERLERMLVRYRLDGREGEWLEGRSGMYAWAAANLSDEDIVNLTVAIRVLRPWTAERAGQSRTAP